MGTNKRYADSIDRRMNARITESETRGHAPVSLTTEELELTTQPLTRTPIPKLRWGEATGLRIENVDALRRRVLVAENAVNVGSQLIVGTPKSHESRSVPFPQFLLPLIQAERRSKGSRDLLFGNGLSHLRPSNSNGGWFNGAVARSRAIDPTFPELSPHDLRHTAASLAISAGANVKAVQRMLGHASAAMTLDVYGDLFEDDLDAVSVRLDTARSESFVGDSWGLGPDETGKAPESQ